MNWDYPPGATPLDPDEAEGLIPKHIVNHGQLNEWEFQNEPEGLTVCVYRAGVSMLSSVYAHRVLCEATLEEQESHFQ